MTSKVKMVVMIAVAIIAVVGLFVPSQEQVNLEGLKYYVDATIENAINKAEFAGTTNYDDLSISESIELGTTLKIGGANEHHAIYLGSNDGCTALYAVASSTLTTEATSTSLCTTN